MNYPLGQDLLQELWVDSATYWNVFYDWSLVTKSDLNWSHGWKRVNYGWLLKEEGTWSRLCRGVNKGVRWSWLSCDILLLLLTWDEVDQDSKLFEEEEILDPLTLDVRKTFCLA